MTAYQRLWRQENGWRVNAYKRKARKKINRELAAIRAKRYIEEKWPVAA